MQGELPFMPRADYRDQFTNEMSIVDIDAHVTESIEDYLPYIDPSFSGVKRLLTRGGGLTGVTDDTKTITCDVGTQIFSATVPAPVEGSMYNPDHVTNTPSVKLDEMDDFGIEYGLVDPTQLNNIHTVQNPTVATALANAYNSWLLDEILDSSERLKGAALIASHRPDLAAEEIDERATEKDIVAVQMPPAGMIPPHGDPKYDPIYEAAQDHGLPIALHCNILSQSFPIQEKWCETYAEAHALAHPFHQIWNTTTYIFRGGPEKYPGLEFIWQEAGLSHIPYLMWRLDDIYMETPDQIPYLEQLPSKYLRDNFYFGSQPLGHIERNPEYLAWIIEMIGPDNVLYSSDLPHPSFDPPNELYRPISGYFEQETIEGIMGGNAKEVLGI